MKNERDFQILEETWEASYFNHPIFLCKASLSELVKLDRRKVYSITLKLLTLLGVVIVMAVMINSLFPVDETGYEVASSTQVTKSQTVTVSIQSLFSGKLMFTQWSGRPVAILKRMNPPQDFKAGEPLNSQWRSVSADYFVFYNTVGVAQCPLYLMPDGEQLKDTCSGILYDTTGKRMSGSGSLLQIPPYYFSTEENNSVVIGQWEALEVGK